MKLCRWCFARSPVSALAVVLMSVLVTGGCVPAFQQPAQHPAPVLQPEPIQVAPPQPQPRNEEKLEALTQLTELKEELKKLRNAVEEIEFDGETAKRRQHNLFEDLDRRLLSLERSQRLFTLQSADALAANAAGGVDGGVAGGVVGGAVDGSVVGGGVVGGVTGGGVTDGVGGGVVDGVTAGGASIGGAVDGATAGGTTAVGASGGGAVGSADVAIVGGGTGATASVTGDAAAASGAVSVLEQQVYDQAFGLLKQSKYQDAIAEFQRLADTWPNGQLADDAYYWMSEARYVNRETEAALSGFRTVLTRYPDSERVPEALLKVGYIQYDIGAYQEAAKIFRDLLARFPGHQVAVSAQTRLRRIENTIQ